jgi:hypothetical protein
MASRSWNLEYHADPEIGSLEEAGCVKMGSVWPDLQVIH